MLKKHEERLHQIHQNQMRAVGLVYGEAAREHDDNSLKKSPEDRKETEYYAGWNAFLGRIDNFEDFKTAMDGFTYGYAKKDQPND